MKHKCTDPLVSQGKINTLEERLHCNMLLALDPVIHFIALTLQLPNAVRYTYTYNLHMTIV